jgi:Rod binding domain-containing protein
MNTPIFHSQDQARLTPAAARHQALVKQTRKWVAQSFYGTLLKQMRDDPFKSDIMDGGRGGQVFNQMLDEQLSEHMTRGAAPGLVNSIVQKIERGKASAYYEQQSQKKLKTRQIQPPTTPRIYVQPTG